MYKNYNLKRLTFTFFIFIFCFSIFISSAYATNYIYDLKGSNDVIFNTDESSISTIAEPEFTFQSVSQILMEPTTGTILYANNENEKLLPASVTKIMSLLLLMEQIDSGKIKYTDKITCSANAASMGGSQIWLKEGEELTIDDALKAICVVSANDVVMAVAEHIGGSEQNFVKMMNEKAKELGMVNTNFVNCHGIDEENHYTTAKDIALMSAELITKHPDVLKYTSIWMDTLRDGTFELSSTNKLIRYYEGANGLKTGYTSNALYNLSASATRNGTTFISVVMKAPTSDIRLEETKQLLNYAFANYETKNICDANTVIDTIIINKNVNNEVNVVIKNTLNSLVEKGNKIETEQVITYNENLVAPIKKDEPIGKIELIEKGTGKTLGTSDLILENDVEKSGFIDYLKKVFKLYIMSN